MSSIVKQHVLDRIAQTEILADPYPHIYVENLFPDRYYDLLRKNWPATRDLTSLSETGRVTKGAYKERFVLSLREQDELCKLSNEKRVFWQEFSAWLLSVDFKKSMLEKFMPFITQYSRQELHELDLIRESLLVRDMTNYSIKPHTDLYSRLMSLLFYCPDDNRHEDLGTSIYVLKDPEIRPRDLTKHHSFDLFEKIKTLPYRRNSLFAFIRTDNSFHGVEPITHENIQRDLILYDMRTEEAYATKPQIFTPSPIQKKTSSSLFGSLLREILKR